MVTTASAQLVTSSPYSRFGLGDLQSSVIAEYSALGGGATALNQPEIINPYNPASYAKFPSKRFLFSTGLNFLGPLSTALNCTGFFFSSNEGMSLDISNVGALLIPDA